MAVVPGQGKRRMACWGNIFDATGWSWRSAMLAGCACVMLVCAAPCALCSRAVAWSKK